MKPTFPFRPRSVSALAICLASTAAVLPAAPVDAAEDTAGAAGAETNTCSIRYTAEEIPAIAAEELWTAHYEDDSWRVVLKAYNAKKAELAGKLKRGENTADLVGVLPLKEQGETATASSVFRNIFDETSSLTPERTGHVPYGALAFMYNADDWRTQVASAGCPAERPAPPKETRAVTVPEGSAVAPKEWQGALIGLLALLGIIAAGTALVPQLAQLQLPQLPPLPFFG
ncbi:hypothetical protein [Corynebacterium urinipleomorphum]|uniref:hypothetical protein n=1 Tax=Corynebacterium urinipleomorphum TaxID=1852380 RepID=UPI000B34C429|nr:hypothetical protein [Corynebacterium urinipleomorphum]